MSTTTKSVPHAKDPDGPPATAAAEEEAAEAKYEEIDRVRDREVYDLLGDLIATHHVSDLAEAKIALLWRYAVSPDKDGHVELGKPRKVSARERAFHDHDFVIALNHVVWHDILTPPQRLALLDHELEHCGRAEKEDGSSTYYVRKHDLEEFNAIARRHGLWRESVEAFVKAALKKQSGPTLFDGLSGPEPLNGTDAPPNETHLLDGETTTSGMPAGDGRWRRTRRIV